MNKRNTSKDMVSTKNKNKVISCSTPEHHGDSPSRDSDSTICDSECSSPVPFLCTQDGTEGETDVVWNFYTPKSGNSSSSRVKNSTPLSRKSKKILKPKDIEKEIPKRRPVRPVQKQTQLFQELYELNQNLHKFMAKKQTAPEKIESGSEEDIFKSQDCSPKCIPKSSSRCLRKNILSSNFGKPDPDAALESDDSMNECLLKASQIVEEKILNTDIIPSKRIKYETRKPCFQTDLNTELETESMDALMNMTMKLDSPIVSKVKCESPRINNDSFDSFVGNLNDSVLEQLTQMPIKTDLSNSKAKDWTVKELVVHDGSPLSRSFLNRHNSMPESPSVQDLNRPSTSGVAFGRFSTMPFQNADKSAVPDNSPIRCTQEEIKKKHQLAREKLMAKRLLPFTSQQTKSLPPQSQLTQLSIPKKTFQPRTANINNVKSTTSSNSLPITISKPVTDVNISKQSNTSTSTTNIHNNNILVKEGNVPKPKFQPKISTRNNITNNQPVSIVNEPKINASSVDLKQLIEKKRQEALLKLRRRQPQNK